MALGKLGSVSGIAMRAMRIILAFISFSFMVSAPNSDVSTFYKDLKVVMPAHAGHAVCILAYDIFYFMRRPIRREGAIYIAIVLSEWVNIHLALGVAAGALTVAMGSQTLQVHICVDKGCNKYFISSVVALMVWFLTAISTIFESLAFGAAWRERNPY